MRPEFVKMLAATGDDRFERLAETLETTSPEVSVRLNPAKGGEDTSVAAMGESRVRWWEGGMYLQARPRFTLDPALHQGRYYVQDASSMVTAAVARAISRAIKEETGGQDAIPLLWLDACAAPGGKSTAALDGLPAGSLVVANEYDYGRAEILKENIVKWGNPSTVITRGDTAQFRSLPPLFDVVAVDAPCSGEGMMRKDITAREQWTPALVEECCGRQREILSNLWDSLRPGGYLVYSTCTFNTSENELMVDWLRREYGAQSVDLRIEGVDDGEVSIDGIAPTYAMRFIPGRTRGEGLFMAVMRKPGTLSPAITCAATADKKKKMTAKGKHGKKTSSAASPTVRDIATVTGWIDPGVASLHDIIPTSEGLRIFPRTWSWLLPMLLDKLQVISAGVEAATIKGRDLLPTHGMALSTILSRYAFPTVEVDEAIAVDYLARETVTLPQGTPNGFVLLAFGGYPLGFVKNIGNRANNLYPKEWRIRSKG